jgi:hypothetical protein
MYFKLQDTYFCCIFLFHFRIVMLPGFTSIHFYSFHILLSAGITMINSQLWLVCFNYLQICNFLCQQKFVKYASELYVYILWSNNTLFHYTECPKTGVHKFSKNLGDISKVKATWRVIWSNFHNEDTQILSNTVQNIVTIVTWCQGFAHSCSQSCLSEFTPMLQGKNTLFRTNIPAESDNEEFQKMFKLLSTFFTAHHTSKTLIYKQSGVSLECEHNLTKQLSGHLVYVSCVLYQTEICCVLCGHLRFRTT